MKAAFLFSRTRTGLTIVALAMALLASCTYGPAPAPPAQTALGTRGSGMGEMTPQQIVDDMKVGWNLGNSLDASPDETGFRNPITTPAMIDAVKAMGFRTVRIPVTWDRHIGPAPDYTIDKAWMDRVEAVVNYVLKDGMYAIVNTHHDDRWVQLTPAGQERGIAESAKVWRQIATRFKDYNDYLILETFNEPHGPVNPYSGGTPESRAILNAYHLASVNAIRATGGNNTKRIIMVCTHGATPSDAAIRDLVIPNNDPRIILSLHTYYPSALSFGNQTNLATWGTDADKAAMRTELDREQRAVAAKGYPAVIGEWASAGRVPLASRVAHAEYYAQQARLRGMAPIWWDDNGTYQLLNRRTDPLTWQWPTIAQALVRGGDNGVVPALEMPK